jgi:hypothetical protein
MAPQLRRLTGLALLAVAAIVLMAGCGGGDGGEDRAQGLTPAELLTRSAAAAEEVESFRIDLDVTGEIAVSEGADIPGGQLLSGPLDISGEGPVVPPDRASIDARITVSGQPLQVNITRVGDDVFIGALGQDFRLDLPPEQVSLLDLGELYPTLVRWTRNPQEAGREEIDGTETVKVTGEIDPRRALADLSPLLGADAPSPADARAALRSGTVEAWIGTEDLLPRRVRLDMSADGSRVAEGVGAVDIDLTANMSAFGEPVDIQAPADAQTLDPENLGGLVGG